MRDNFLLFFFKNECHFVQGRSLQIAYYFLYVYDSKIMYQYSMPMLF